MKKNNKGFTLVELIVVLVILAILAAILVPALLGYIDRAKEKQYVLNAKSYLTAAQAELSAIYGESGDPAAIKTGNARNATVVSTADVPTATKVIVGCKSTYNSATSHKSQHDAFTITYVQYEEDGYTIYYNGKAWVQDAPTAPAATYQVK